MAIIVVDEEICAVLESIPHHNQMHVTALIAQILSELDAPR